MTMKAYVGIRLYKHEGGNWQTQHLSWGRDSDSNRNVPYGRWTPFNSKYPPKCTGKWKRTSTMRHYQNFKEDTAKYYEASGRPIDKNPPGYILRIDAGVFPMELFY